MVSADQVLKIAIQYLSDNDAERFAQDFADVSYNIHKSGEADAVNLVRAIEFKLADLRAGCIQKSAFLIALRKMVVESVLASNIPALLAANDPINVPGVVVAYPEWAESSGTVPSAEYVLGLPVPA